MVLVLVAEEEEEEEEVIHVHETNGGRSSLQKI